MVDQEHLTPTQLADPPPTGLVFRRATTVTYQDGCWDEVVNITHPPSAANAQRKAEWDPGSWIWQHIEPTHTWLGHVPVEEP